jgi:hypothetical protein
MTYFIIKNKITGEYYRGKGVNKWGKYYNQASIYRIKGMAKDSLEDLIRRGEEVEIIPIKILETSEEVSEVRKGKWVKQYKSGNPVSEGWVSSCCDMWHKSHTDFCPYCGASMT